MKSACIFGALLMLCLLPLALSTDSSADSSVDSSVDSSAGSSAGSCADMECPPGTDSCCDDVRLGPTCYDSGIASCPSGSRGTILCGFQEHGEDFACGVWCYDKHVYDCCNETLYQLGSSENPCIDGGEATTAPIPATSAPVPATVSPSLAPTAAPSGTCADFACPEDTDACCDDVRLGPSCYNSGDASCPTGSEGPILCGFEEYGQDAAACGLWCYDYHVHSCCNDTLFLLGASPCDADSSDVPTAAPATSCENMLCPPGLDQCCDDVNLGPTCYNSGIASCPIGSQGPILCGFQENGEDFACGLKCYDAVYFECCNDAIYQIGDSPCSSGTATTIPATSAPATSAPEDSSALDDSSVPVNSGARFTAGMMILGVVLVAVI